MLRNVWKNKASLECNSSLKNLESVTKDSTATITSATNRDSGIFEDFSNFNISEDESEDYFLPGIVLDEEDNCNYFDLGLEFSQEEKDSQDYFQPGINLSQEDKGDYFLHDTESDSDRDYFSSDEEDLTDSDRRHHASLSSLDTSADSSSLSNSLSSLNTSSEEDSDLDFNSSDSEDNNDALSDSSKEEQDASASFGYHSLLNDSSAEEDGSDYNDFEDVRELKVAENTEGDPFEQDHVYLTSKFTSISPVLSLYDNHHPYIRNSTASLNSCCDFPSSSYYSSEDEEDPSDIELKMAETEIKMCDAILSSGLEELSMRKMHLKKAEMVEALNRKQQQQIHENDFKLPNNNTINNNYKEEMFANLQRKEREVNHTMMNLPLKTIGNEQNQQQWGSGDNRFNSSMESPIVDAYEKECRDVPEKMTKELESNEYMDMRKKKRDVQKLSEMDIEHDEDMLAFEAVMKEAIKNKEAVSHSDQRIILDSNDAFDTRHRPNSKQRRRGRNALRRNLPSQTSDNRLASPEEGEFDVYNMESALPKIDWEAIEEHFEASQEEEERWRRTNREEIRKKLAMGTDEQEDDEDDSQLKKPSLHSRLQNGKSKNLQICFMNETASDCDSQNSDTESTQDRIDELEFSRDCKELEPKNFLTRQARLQEEARLALAQAKEMAKMQMKIEKQNRKKSPITEIVRGSFNKIGFPCPDNKRRMSRQIITEMNVAQLQVIVNEFHSQIENLNEVLVQLLLRRDDLHMEQDSMLVDIEDLTKHLGSKDGRVLLAQDNKSSKSSKRSSKLRPFKNK